MIKMLVAPRLLIFFAMLESVASCRSVAAAVYTWTGGAGATWNTSSANWSSGGGGTLWDSVNGPLNVADFNIAGATPNVSGTIYTNAITFTASGTIENGTIELSGATPTIAANANATIASVLDGTAGLTVAGSASLTLTNANNYSGGTTINGGALSIGSDSNLGAVPSTFTAASIALNAGTLQFTLGSAFHTPTISSSRGITLGVRRREHQYT